MSSPTLKKIEPYPESTFDPVILTDPDNRISPWALLFLTNHGNPPPSV